MSHKMSQPLEALLSSRDSGWLGDDVNSQAEGTDGGWHWAVAVTDVSLMKLKIVQMLLHISTLHHDSTINQLNRTKL